MRYVVNTTKLLQMYVRTRARCTDKTRCGMMTVMPSVFVRMLPQVTTGAKKGV